MESLSTAPLESFPQFSFKHKKLGEIVGLARGEDIVQFRGIPFASIAARFRQAQLLESLPSQPFDARKSGPHCPQPWLPFFPPYWDAALPADFPSLPVPLQDEFGCLNLSITCPRSVLEQDSLEKLPVLVFIHGGAFVGGGQSIQIAGREIYDGTNLVRASIARNQPVVLVTYNYRVGNFGFLASRELLEFNRKHGEPVGNYGLHDQRQALEWCHRFIAGFGGDAANMTIQGTSAGGGSAHYLSIFPDRKFKRAILSSGTLTGIGPMSIEYQQKKFDAYLSRHSSERTTPCTPVEILQSIPAEQMMKPLSGNLTHPLIDGEWIPDMKMQGNAEIYAGSTAPDLMVGACNFEIDVTQLLLMDPISQKPASDSNIRKVVFDIVSSNAMISKPEDFPNEYPTVTDAYELTSSLETSSTPMLVWAEMLADIAFRIPPLHIATHHPANVLVYDIKCKNPYPAWNPTFGRANHAVNDVFLFDVAPDLVPDELRAAHDGNVKQIRAAWLDFCYGKLPWSPIARDGSQLGPVHVFEHGSEGRDGQSLEDAMGEKTAKRWRAVLEANS